MKQEPPQRDLGGLCLSSVQNQIKPVARGAYSHPQERTRSNRIQSRTLRGRVPRCRRWTRDTGSGSSGMAGYRCDKDTSLKLTSASPHVWLTGFSRPRFLTRPGISLGHRRVAGPKQKPAAAGAERVRFESRSRCVPNGAAVEWFAACHRLQNAVDWQRVHSPDRSVRRASAGWRYSLGLIST